MGMSERVVSRAVDHAKLILNGYSLREIGRMNNVSKTTVHIDVTTRLRKIDYVLYTHVQEQLDQNFNEKHIKGALATIAVWEQKIKELGNEKIL